MFWSSVSSSLSIYGRNNSAIFFEKVLFRLDRFSLSVFMIHRQLTIHFRIKSWWIFLSVCNFYLSVRYETSNNTHIADMVSVTYHFGTNGDQRLKSSKWSLKMSLRRTWDVSSICSMERFKNSSEITSQICHECYVPKTGFQELL